MAELQPSTGAGPPSAPGPGRASDEGRWPVLATRNARLLLATRLTGQFADGLLQAALGTFVLFSPERQATAGQVAAAFALLLLPYSLIGPFAGVLLDRWRRASVLLWANVARAAIMVGVAGLVALEHGGLDLGAAVLASMGIGRLWLAGLSAGLPRTVAPAHLVTANALFPTAGTIASGAATVLGLVLMPILGPGAAPRLVLCVAAGLALSAMVASRIPADDLGPEEDASARSLTADLTAVVRGMVAGVRHVHSRPRARRGMAVVMAHRLAFGALVVDALLIVRNTLHTPAEAQAALADFAVTAAGASAGSLLGALLAPAMTRRLGLARWSALTLTVAAAAPLGFATRSLALMALGSLAMGVSGQTVKIAGDTLIQRDVADEFRGRVFSLYDVGLNVALVSGICVTALVAPATGVAPGLWLAVSALLVATAAWSLRPVHAAG